MHPKNIIKVDFRTILIGPGFWISWIGRAIFLRFEFWMLVDRICKETCLLGSSLKRLNRRRLSGENIRPELSDSFAFSELRIRYLASGKPALVQDTGFSKNLPVGEGLIAFRTLDEAVAGAESIARDYEKHAHAARALAEEYFDSDKVLKALLNEVGVAP